MINKIRSIIREYHYGKFYLIDNNIKITIDRRKKFIQITNFFRNGEKEGDCIEISKTLQKQLKLKLPQLSTRIVEGNAPHVFVPLTGPHYFLLASKSRIIENAEEIKKEGALEKLNPLLIDPSLQFIGELNFSGYIVSDIVANGLDEFPFEPDLKLENGFYTPLGLTSDLRVVLLTADFKTPEVLIVWVQGQDENRDFTELPLGSLNLKKILHGETKLLRLIDCIHSKNPMAKKK